MFWMGITRAAWLPLAKGLSDPLLQLDRSSRACRSDLRARSSALGPWHRRLSPTVPKL